MGVELIDPIAHMSWIVFHPQCIANNPGSTRRLLTGKSSQRGGVILRLDCELIYLRSKKMAGMIIPRMTQCISCVYTICCIYIWIYIYIHVNTKKEPRF